MTITSCFIYRFHLAFEHLVDCGMIAASGQLFFLQTVLNLLKKGTRYCAMLELNERCIGTFFIIICCMIFIHKIHCAGFVKTALVERIILRINYYN